MQQDILFSLSLFVSGHVYDAENKRAEAQSTFERVLDWSPDIGMSLLSMRLTE
jgi:hypothetical protein